MANHSLNDTDVSAQDQIFSKRHNTYPRKSTRSIAAVDLPLFIKAPVFVRLTEDFFAEECHMHLSHVNVTRPAWRPEQTLAEANEPRRLGITHARITASARSSVPSPSTMPSSVNRSTVVSPLTFTAPLAIWSAQPLSSPVCSFRRQMNARERLCTYRNLDLATHE